MKSSYLIKLATTLYTYVDPEADLSKGLLSMRNAPEDAVVRRYAGRVPEGSNKDYIISRIEALDKTRPDWIYAFDSPIPDRATEELRNFRDTHKLVSFDPSKLKDVIRILRKYNRKNPEEVDVSNFEPLQRVQWGRKPDRGWFKYSPAYKILTESGRIPPELLTKESKAISFPAEEIPSLKDKSYLYTTRVSRDFKRYKPGDVVTTPWGGNYLVNSADVYNDVKQHKFYDELTPEQIELLKKYKVMKLLLLTKQN